MDKYGRKEIIIPAGTVIKPDSYYQPITTVGAICRKTRIAFLVMLGPGEFAWIKRKGYAEANFDKDGKLIEK